MSARSLLVPALDFPPRRAIAAGMAFLLAVDAALLVSLSKAFLVSAVLAAVVVSILLASRLPWLLALMAAGYPLLTPIDTAIGSEVPVFAALRFTLALGFLWIVFAKINEPGRLAGRLSGDPILLWSLGLGLLIAAGWLHSPSAAYGRMKVIGYFATNLPLLVAGFLVASPYTDRHPGQGDKRLDSLLAAVILFGLLVAGAALINRVYFPHRFGTRLTALGQNPIWIGRIMGLALLGLVSLYNLRRIRPAFALLLSIPLGLVMVLAGSRGPLIGFVVVMIVQVIVLSRISGPRRLATVAMAVAFVGILFLSLPDGTRERFLHPVRQDISGIVRLRLLGAAREALSHAFGLGIGTGGFSDLMKMGELRFYPHNIFAEIGIENGLPGLAALLGFLWVAFAAATRHRGDPRMRAMFLGFLFALLNAQFSGDLIANEWIWLFAGLIAGRAHG